MRALGYFLALSVTAGIALGMLLSLSVLVTLHVIGWV